MRKSRFRNKSYSRILKINIFFDSFFFTIGGEKWGTRETYVANMETGGMKRVNYG